MKISPSARKLAEAKGVDLAAVSGSGPGGRIVKSDIEAAPGIGLVEAPPSPPSTPPAANSSPADASATASEPSVKVSPIARRMAEELSIDLSLISGSGPKGRIVKADIENFDPAAARAQASQSTDVLASPARSR